jgi:hypothetical protein
MAKRPAKPKRQKKSDRLMYSGISKEEMMCDMAIAPMDRLAEHYDQVWGIDRLPELVTPETAAKFGSAMQKLNAALEVNDPAEVQLRAEVVMRGLHAMDAEAKRLGAQPASTDVWEAEINGKVYGIMRDARAWKSIQDQRPDLKLVTLREVALALEMYGNSVAGKATEAVKQAFGEQAEAVGLRKKENLDDEIPW